MSMKVTYLWEKDESGDYPEEYILERWYLHTHHDTTGEIFPSATISKVNEDSEGRPWHTRWFTKSEPDGNNGEFFNTFDEAQKYCEEVLLFREKEANESDKKA